MNIILGVTGSVAATLVPKIVGKLLKEDHKVKVIASKPSLYFFKEPEVSYSTISGICHFNSS